MGGRLCKTPVPSTIATDQPVLGSSRKCRQCWANRGNLHGDRDHRDTRNALGRLGRRAIKFDLKDDWGGRDSHRAAVGRWELRSYRKIPRSQIQN